MPHALGNIPEPTVRRLSLYLRQLEKLESESQPTFSSQSLADALGLTAAQVRKDLAYFGQFGRTGLGYSVSQLVHRLRQILGTDRLTLAVLVGVGNIGRALATYEGFTPKGFQLIGIFDTDPRKIGRKVGTLTIDSLANMAKAVEKYGVRLGIIAVPAQAALQVARAMRDSGIRGILNFAPVPLSHVEGVKVRNIDVAAELEQINYLSSQTPDYQSAAQPPAAPPRGKPRADRSA